MLYEIKYSSKLGYRYGYTTIRLDNTVGDVEYIILLEPKCQIKEVNTVTQQKQRQSVFNSQGSNSYFRISLPYFISDQIQDYSGNQDDAPFYDTVAQTSVYQAPLLNFTSFIQELAQKTQQKTDEEKLILLQQFKPLINPSYLPVFCSNPSKMRCKFSPIDEALLLQGLQKHTSKSLTSIQKGYLWDKDLKQIKNKYKNSICSNAIQNRIKQWKLNQYSYLTKSEVKSLIKGIKWFDKRWKLISRYFVHNRTSEFLEAEFKKSDTLLKKRRKHGVDEVYPEHYQMLKHYFHFPQGESSGQIHKLQKQTTIAKQDLSSQVKNLMQKTQITDHQPQGEPNQNSVQVENYLNFQNYQGFDFSNSFLLRSSNHFNNIDFNLSMQNPQFDEKSKLKVEDDKKQILENQDSLVSPHFNNDIIQEFRLDGYESRSRSRYFINSMNMINSRMFQSMDQVNSRFQPLDALLKFETKIEQPQKKQTLQGIDKWRSVLDNFDKFPNNK